MKKLLVLLFVLGCAITTQAQLGQTTLSSFYEQVKKAHYENGVLVEHVNYKGSPYLNEKFQAGEVITNQNMAFKNLLLRYDIYNDQIEFKKDSEILIVPKNNFVIKAVMAQDTFILLPHANGTTGFYQQVHINKTSLLKKYSVDFNPAQKPQAYQDAKPAEYVRKSDDFYLLLSDRSVHKISGLKSIIELFPQKDKEIKDFVKTNKLNVKKETALIKLTDYISTL